MSIPNQNPHEMSANPDKQTAFEDAASLIALKAAETAKALQIEADAAETAQIGEADEIADAEGQSIDDSDAIAESESEDSIDAEEDAEADEETAAAAASAAANASSSASGSSGTSGGTARGVEEHAIEKWTAEQQKVYESVRDKTQELGIPKDDVERIAAFSVLQFMNEKDRKPDTRVDRVQAVNAKGDVIVRMEHMKYGDREPIFNNDVRLKDAPAFEQSAAQIEQANGRVHGQQKVEQEIAQHHQNQDTNQQERPNTLQLVDDQISARLQSSMPALTRGR
jgi:hypothetical protein